MSGHKSMLYEYCQKKKFRPPYFDTAVATGEVNGYRSEVVLEDTRFGLGEVFSKKKQAESDAARVCLIALGLLNETKGGNDGKGTEESKAAAEEKAGEGESTNGNETAENLPSVSDLDTSPFAKSPSLFSSPSPGGMTQAKKPKSILHEFCQKHKMSLPQYDTQAIRSGPRLDGYTCVLSLNGEKYTCDSLFPNKRDAEHYVANKALAAISHLPNMPSPFAAGSTQTFSVSPELWYKSILQEHLHQRSLESPVYDTVMKDSGFTSTVVIEGKQVTGAECTSKKLAEQSAAKAGLVELGIKDPEAVALRLLRRRSRGGRFRMPQPFPFRTRLPTGYEKETWVHARPPSGFDTDDYDEPDSNYIDFQVAEPVKLKRSHDSTGDEETPTKKQRVGDSSENKGRPRYRSRRDDYGLADVHLGNLSVGEAWPEKRNVVIVGSDETSIPLYCNGAPGRCALEDKTAEMVMDIIPGHRLVGLEGHYIERGGQIVLRARRCEEVILPPETDKVLVSCGVVVMHCIPRKNESGKSCDVNILLKRYLCSQAFVNVVRGLAQFFRNKMFDRPFTLDKQMLVRNISEWMLEEVMAITSMTEDSIRNVFMHTMKFDKRWGKFLKEESMPEELKELQALAEAELGRRACTQEDQNQDRYRPWRLPKGNFYHRILSTGVFIESPAECAMRELREETGIRLKLNDVSSSPFVDLPQNDNLNPHKGDVARYYLCGIITEDDDLAKGTNQEQPAEQPSESPTLQSSENLTTDPTTLSEPKTPDKSLSSEEASIIRSPSVAGALHEECTWFDVDSAKETSHVFNEVYQTSEFQKLLAKLTKIVSDM